MFRHTVGVSTLERSLSLNPGHDGIKLILMVQGSPLVMIANCYREHAPFGQPSADLVYRLSDRSTLALSRTSLTRPLHPWRFCSLNPGHDGIKLILMLTK